MRVQIAAALVSVGLLGCFSGSSSTPATPTAPEATAKAARPAPDQALVRDALGQRRAKNVASFRTYRESRVYPHNTYRDGPLNVWRDETGRLCAAATIIHLDGRTGLVETVAQTNNFLRLANVTEGELLDWMLTSGLTIEEIDRIQVPGFSDNWNEPERVDPYQEEDARLARVYESTEAALINGEEIALGKATRRLMKYPELAWRLLDETR